MLKHTKNFEGADNYEKLVEKDPEERAHAYAQGAFRYGAAWMVGMAATIGSEQLILSKALKAPKVPLSFYSIDSLMTGALIGLMATPAVAPVTDKAKQVIKAVSSTLGADEGQAEDISRLTVITAIPNYTVFGIVSAQLYQHNKLGTSKLGELAEKIGVLPNLSRSK